MLVPFSILRDIAAYEVKRVVRIAVTDFCAGWLRPDWTPAATLPTRFAVWLDGATRDAKPQELP
jgi:hypothetical protein